jgi:hypothetical protein
MNLDLDPHLAFPAAHRIWNETVDLVVELRV